MRLQKIIFGVIVGGLFVFVSFFVSSGFVIGQGVKEQCKLAQQHYHGDCVEVLIAVVDNEDENFKKRNSAIWALGQLGDSRAESILLKYYEEDMLDKQPLDETLSQYEIRKALKLVRGGFNATAIIWR